ncbi:MAG TPA: class I SAM-dependent methyltransferase [Chitinophagaceae bacterium]|nr:class I SAM-dependent methyltransferase [Chitinophagaceae bacterium]
MYGKLTLATKFLRYYLTASNGKGHGIHSPFVFKLVQQVLNSRKQYYAYAAIEAARKRMLNDHTVITVEDKGAGSTVSNSRKRSIRDIARSALKPPKYAQLLFRMVNFYQPRHILELGTSLGITTAYMASANPAANITTIEGAEAIAHKAIENFSRLNLQNIRVVRGDFDEVLQPTLQAMPRVDLAFIDGNHRREPTLRYLNEILPYCHAETILVFDDIHWSSGMEAAWEDIKAHPAITGTVDIFLLGLAFLREEFREKQHFTIRF